MATDLREVELRSKVEQDVLNDLAEQEVAEFDRDRAVTAVLISLIGAGLAALIVVLAVIVPLAGAAFGAAVRLFGWASGLY